MTEMAYVNILTGIYCLDMCKMSNISRQTVNDTNSVQYPICKLDRTVECTKCAQRHPVFVV